MITCPSCGAQNDPANRFCDQCGTRLEAAAPAAATALATAAHCPSCGATVLPGEAFCDNCGADLTALAVTPAPTLSADAPTALAEPGTAPPSTPGSVSNCPVCGAQTIPGERFCDNCGADLQAALAAPAVSPNDATLVAPPVAPDDATIVASATPVAAEPTPASVEATPEPAAETAPAPAEAAPVPVEVEAEAPPAPAEAAPVAPAEAAPAPAAPAAPAVDSERQRLEDLVAAHRDTVAQYEQMAARYPAGSPPVFIAAGLEDAKRALAQAEADLAAYVAAPAGPDPAEVARLEQLAAAHRDTVAQYEQMVARYPAGSVPTFLTAGLEEAQRALAQAEVDLASLLSGGAPAAPAAAPVEAPAAPVPTPAPAEAPAAPAAPAPAPAPVALGPRLVTADGQVIVLPVDKAEIIVGREDPVSNIFPEVDLTPHGGEQGGVSRQHARLTHVGDQWALVDLNSTNYTRVDGVRAEPNVSLPLHDGAKIQFGRVVTTFYLYSGEQNA
jgi:uncharacterized OB-fold protein